MRRPSRVVRPLLCGIVAALLMTAPAAFAIGVDADESTALAASHRGAELQSRPGAWCPIGGCKAPSSARLSDVAAFGSTILLCAWLSRRQVPSPH